MGPSPEERGVATTRRLRAAVLLVVTAAAVLVTAYLLLRTYYEGGFARPVRFVEYDETGEWRTWENEQFSVRIPAVWEVVREADSASLATTAKTWRYSFTDQSGTRRPSSEITVVSGGPRFVEYLVAPKHRYRHSLVDGCDVWEFSGDGFHCVQVAGDVYRVAVAVALDPDAEDVEEPMLCHIAESVRAK